MALSGVGTTFSRGVDSSGYATISEINSISWGGMSRNTIDTTSLDTTGGYRTFITGFRDAGEITLEMNFTEDGYGTMLADFELSAERDYRITFPSPLGTQFDMAGLVTRMPLSIPTDDKITCTVTIKITGQITMTS